MVHMWRTLQPQCCPATPSPLLRHGYLAQQVGCESQQDIPPSPTQRPRRLQTSRCSSQPGNSTDPDGSKTAANRGRDPNDGQVRQPIGEKAELVQSKSLCETLVLLCILGVWEWGACLGKDLASENTQGL